MMDGLKIVIAEENALIGMDLAELLTELGHHVCALISTETEAVAASARCKPDMMIVDSILANGSGVNAMHRILEQGPMPHFFLADYPSEVFATDPDAVVVTKPFNLHELACGIAAVRLCCGPLVPHSLELARCIPSCPFPTCFQRR